MCKEKMHVKASNIGGEGMKCGQSRRFRERMILEETGENIISYNNFTTIHEISCVICSAFNCNFEMFTEIRMQIY